MTDIWKRYVRSGAHWSLASGEHAGTMGCINEMIKGGREKGRERGGGGGSCPLSRLPSSSNVGLATSSNLPASSHELRRFAGIEQQ